jgi:hypothetical protein
MTVEIYCIVRAERFFEIEVSSPAIAAQYAESRYLVSMQAGWPKPAAAWAGLKAPDAKGRRMDSVSLGMSGLSVRGDMLTKLFGADGKEDIEYLEVDLDGVPWFLINLYARAVPLLERYSLTDDLLFPRPGFRYKRAQHVVLPYSKRLDDLPFCLSGESFRDTYCGPAFKAVVERAGVKVLRFYPVGHFVVPNEPLPPDRSQEQAQLSASTRARMEEAVRVVSERQARIDARRPEKPAPMPSELKEPTSTLERHLSATAAAPLESDALLLRLNDAVEAVRLNTIDPSGARATAEVPNAVAVDAEASRLGLIGLLGRLITERARWRWEVKTSTRAGTRYLVVSEQDEHQINLGDYIARQLRSRRPSTLALTVNCIELGNLPDAEPGQRVKLR